MQQRNMHREKANKVEGRRHRSAQRNTMKPKQICIVGCSFTELRAKMVGETRSWNQWRHTTGDIQSTEAIL